MSYNRFRVLQHRLLYFLSNWSRPPTIARVELREILEPSLNMVEPTFVLSTGRCGTTWLSALMRTDKRVRVNHSDYPELIRESRLAFDEYEQDPRLFQEILRAARDGYILEARQHRMAYVETNHRLTFFAHAARAVYPRSRFIHLVRHPGDFARSAIRRCWYSGSQYDACRPCMKDQSNWDQISNVEKVAWLWNTTNQYIERFAASMPDNARLLRIKFEDLTSDPGVAARVCAFAGARVGVRTARSMLDKRLNKQLAGSMPPFDRWSETEKAELRRWTPLAARYGYLDDPA